MIEVESREARFMAETMRRYPLHDYRRLAPLMHQLRAVKSDLEVGPDPPRVRRDGGSVRASAPVCQTRGGRMGGRGGILARVHPPAMPPFAYLPIIASGPNACVLHYVANDQPVQEGRIAFAGRGRQPRQLQRRHDAHHPGQRTLYAAPETGLSSRLARPAASAAALRPGKKIKDWQKEAEKLMEKELVDLGLLTVRQIKRQDPDDPAVKKYFMHGVGHPLGLDVHDVA